MPVLNHYILKPAEFLNQYKQTPIIAEIIDQLRQPDHQRVGVKGLAGSAASVIVASIFRSVLSPFVCVLSSREEAAYFFNDLENLLGEKDLSYEKRNIFLLPSSFKKPFEKTDPDKAGVLLRSEVINRLTSDPGKFIVVSYPEGLAEKIVSPEVISKNILRLHKEEQTSVDFIMELLLEYGFHRVDFVVEPGQFSLRGGIVDVFSYSNDFPFRIEIMGDQIESLRTFNPENQISIEKLDEISVLPDLNQLSENSRKEDFFSILPSNTIFWNDDTFFMIEKLRVWQDKPEVRSQSAENNSSPVFDLIDDNIFSSRLQRFHLVEFRRHHFCQQNIFEFNFSPQPSFNKNFDLLIDNLKDKTSGGYINYLLSDNPRQLARIHSIFETMQEKDLQKKGFNHETLTLNLHEGFIDRVNKICCYTDHQIFERYYRFRIRDKFPGKKALTLKEINNLQPGDYITHIDHGVGIFSGLEKIEVNGKLQEAIRLIYKGNDILYISIHSLHRISRFVGKDGSEPVLNKLGSPAWSNLKKKTKSKVKDIAKDLIKLYARRKAQEGFAFSPDSYLQNELEASFIYEDTPDQVKA
ncbi:MAG: CarD family transcriptional regulator, partial [Bacteroidota bacterium]